MFVFILNERFSKPNGDFRIILFMSIKVVKPKCMTPVTNAMIWKRMILPTGLYACEIWGGLSNTEIDLLERTQRYAARFIQCINVVKRM
jgi:hypothetical protein